MTATLDRSAAAGCGDTARLAARTERAMKSTVSLPIVAAPTAPPQPASALTRGAALITALQSTGMRWISPDGPGLSRHGGAGPSDHKAVTIAGQTVMVPIFTHGASRSPYRAEVAADGYTATLYHRADAIAELRVPQAPRFYQRHTSDGVPYWKIATLHGADVLASTVLQTCTRYGHRDTSCQFCAIGQSLAAKSTIARKRPDQLAEVARAAVELDGVRHAVLTTGTPASADRGAALLTECSAAITAAVAEVGAELPIQAQCEPPDDLGWFERLRAAGVRTLGMHLEAVSEPVRRRVMPSKAEIPVAYYLEAFERAVAVFGRAQVTTYIIAGLGDRADQILSMCERIIEIGVYPFVVPLVPIAGTPLAEQPAPDAAFMGPLLDGVAALLRRYGMHSRDIAAGCGRCGACSSMRAREVAHA